MGGEHSPSAATAIGFIGSSPRGRGTPPAKRSLRLVPRFIPAWAGNTSRRQARAACLPVHPRVGGEHAISVKPGSRAAGSSPRGRGTHLDLRRLRVRFRFIPAWAGNTHPLPRPICTAAVHPRVGGEHTSEKLRNLSQTGSSPRGRGTLGLAVRAGYEKRFIPAWAGNTAFSHGAARAAPVHPRVGGEHGCAIHRGRGRAGSSPRGRGTQSRRKAGAACHRFIPAWAGNTARLRDRRDWPTVHPRVGGEHGTAGATARLTYGSSPRGRGTRAAAALEAPAPRFIPAWAGNTRPRAS